MAKIFVQIYRSLKRRIILRYSLLLGSFMLLLAFATQLRFEEEINRFFPDTDKAKDSERIFQNLRFKDKIIVLLSLKDRHLIDEETGTTILIDEADLLSERLRNSLEPELAKQVFSEVDAGTMAKLSNQLFGSLPIYLEESEYLRFDSLTSSEAVASSIEHSYMQLLMPSSIGSKDYIQQDPLGLAGRAFQRFRALEPNQNYAIVNGHLFTKDLSQLILLISPKHGMASTGKNEDLVRLLERDINMSMQAKPELIAQYYGGPSVSVYNARQIKQDTMITLTVAMLIITLFTLLVFRSRSSVFLIIMPVVYGATFALALIFFIKGAVSAIAIGAGAAVFGVALSYSIHVLSHFNYVDDVEQLIAELAYPLTVGSFTTVGAFFALLFTSSDILRDFGLFSALALIGTTLFCLVFLPHFLSKKDRQQEGKLFRLIDRINSYAFHKNKGIVVLVLALLFVGIFLSDRVKFDSNMQHLNYEPKHLKEAEALVSKHFGEEQKQTLLITYADSPKELLQQYRINNQKLEELQEKGWIDSYQSVEELFVPEQLQTQRIARWNAYWTSEKKQKLRADIEKNASVYGFSDTAFEPFFETLDRVYQPNLSLKEEEDLGLFEAWMQRGDSSYMLFSKVNLPENRKQALYSELIKQPGLLIFDRGHFANQWVEAINDDFYTMLFASSILIFIALLISYGRIELTLMAFAPMAISWLIILGLMAVFGIQFNIVNIILSTFIFGLGDDFAIFIMDALQQKNKNGRRLLNAHKSAIFFSAITAIVGLGSLAFAKHPALQSISLISVIGIVSVVLVAYTFLPILFSIFIGKPSSKGLFPYTFSSILHSLHFYGLFSVGCSLMLAFAGLLFPLPLSKKKKKAAFSYLLHKLIRVFMRSAWIVRLKMDNPEGESFAKPAVIIANHQSFIDILILLCLRPKLVMLTNSWVWNSPLFGHIVRYAEFMQVVDGYDAVLSQLKEKVADGYSIVVFPEGTRSTDGSIKRFRKGAFYMAQELQIDILPISLYGTGMIIGKRQPLYIKRGIIHSWVLPRIAAGSTDFGSSYQERSKAIRKLMMQCYKEQCMRFDNTDNAYFYHSLMANYIFKGPILEWYMRIKVKMEKRYAYFHQLIPRQAKICDIGCGYGPMDYMLALLAPEREIIAIDYDEEKIALAQHSFQRRNMEQRLRFVHADALSFQVPSSDVFILSDILHYLIFEEQTELIGRCVKELQEGGMIVIRDSNAEQTDAHKLTRLSEWFSTRVFAFNKKDRELQFPDEAQFQRIAKTHGLLCQTQANDRFSSNTIYILSKPKG